MCCCSVDALTIAPTLLAELERCTAPLPRALQPLGHDPLDHPRMHMAGPGAEARFRQLMCADAMASELLGGGIAGFSRDQRTLEVDIAAFIDNL